MAGNNFRVVIVGAGPVGLFMAHALDRANIDFVLLEEQDQVVRHAGAGIGLFPDVRRALDQIGVLEHIPQAPLHHMTELVTNGVVLRECPVFDILRDCLGYGPTITSRRDLIEVLYTTLPRREERIRTSSKVINVELIDEGVMVRLDDGNTIQGSILIGCDGVHSRTRAAMQQIRRETGEAAKIEETAIMKKLYAGIYGRVDNPEGIAPGHVFEIHQADWMMQIFRGEERAWYAVLSNSRQRPDTDKSGPASRGDRYTVEERDKFAEECSHLLVTPDGLTFGDIWARTDKASAVMVDQEQGCLDKWHHGGRIVMVGDSQLKVTSTTGSGFSTGVNSATALANELHGLLAGVADGAQPSAQSLDAAFGRYQEARMAACEKILREDQSRMERSVWSSWFWWLLDRWVLRPPLFNLNKVIRDTMAPQMANASLLAYIPFEGVAGSTAWTTVQAKA